MYNVIYALLETKKAVKDIKEINFCFVFWPNPQIVSNVYYVHNYDSKNTSDQICKTVPYKSTLIHM